MTTFLLIASHVSGLVVGAYCGWWVHDIHARRTPGNARGPE